MRNPACLVTVLVLCIAFDVVADDAGIVVEREITERESFHLRKVTLPEKDFRGFYRVRAQAALSGEGARAFARAFDPDRVMLAEASTAQDGDLTATFFHGGNRTREGGTRLSKELALQAFAGMARALGRLKNRCGLQLREAG